MTLPTFNVPPIGPRQGKEWGDTQLLFAFNGTESHLIRVVKGGFSSKHKHQHKWNRFILISGRLLVIMVHENETKDRTELQPGQVTDVPPGVVHGFEAMEDSVAVEIYWVGLDASDIDRGNSHGGIKTDE